MRNKLSVVTLGLFFAAALVAGCSSMDGMSTGGTGYPGSTLPAASLPPPVTPPPSSATATISSNVSANAWVSLGATSGISAQIMLPAAVSGSGTVTINGATSPPNGVTPFVLTRPQPSASASASPSPLPSASPIGYLQVTPSATASFNALPSFSILLPLSVTTSGEAFYIGFYTNDPNYTSIGAYQQWVAPLFGPATISNQTLNFNATSSNGVTLSPNYYYLFGLYSLPSASPSPSPSSPASASPSPSGSPSSSPSPATT